MTLPSDEELEHRQQLAIWQRTLGYQLRPHDVFSEPSESRRWAVMEYCVNAAGHLRQPYCFYPTFEEALAGMRDAIDAAFSFASSMNGERLSDQFEKQSEDNLLIYYWIFPDTEDVFGIGFYIEEISEKN